MLLALLVIFTAAFVQGLTSFGLTLVAVPFLLRIMSLQEIIPIMVILSLLINTYMLIGSRKQLKFKKFKLLVLAGILFLPVGTFALKYLEANYLKLGFGILVSAFAFLLMLKKTFPIQREKTGYIVTGMLSGFLNGSLSSSGPPVALFLSMQGTDKNTFRANITLYFLILNVITIGLFVANGLLNLAMFGKALSLAPALLSGVFVGSKLFKVIGEAAFRKLVLVVLIASGVWTTVSTVLQMVK